MSVKINKDGKIPNWISENAWSAENRLDWINQIMAFSPRCWSVVQPTDQKYYDAESWAIWCLACCDSKDAALEAWNNFCNGD